jgi:hypothetical protein
MRNLICWCPQTQRPIDLQLLTDYATLARIWSSSVRFHCQHCGADHETKVGACLQTTLARTASSETHDASELEENTEVHRQSTERPASLRAELQPPDPNVGPTAVGSPAAMPREKLFQRVWPRMMIGILFVIEVVWIVFLVYLSIVFIRFAFLKPMPHALVAPSVQAIF